MSSQIKHSPGNPGRFSMNGVSIYQDGARDIGEINGGVVGMITPEVAFRADAGIQLGEHGYHNTSAMLSVEYRF
ncbi:autotransporter outer membrane beta-barrel domain-containing protein [Escherichia coli]|uniref:autotransporter outer membrane beta-barrel domain-containing protein n=1 Tax=Escherichia coli TaxID=562 RepID=UPI003D9C8818